jgi:hypothetical protein
VSSVNASASSPTGPPSRDCCFSLSRTRSSNVISSWSGQPWFSRAWEQQRWRGCVTWRLVLGCSSAVTTASRRSNRQRQRGLPGRLPGKGSKPEVRIAPAAPG